MSSGYQLPQTNHAQTEFAIHYPQEFKEWYSNSNSIISLSVKNERELYNLSIKLENHNFKVCRFFEPDIQELTAISIVPQDGVKEMCSKLHLAGKCSASKEREHKLMDIVEDMESCKNSIGQSVLEHGHSVRNHLFELIEFLKNPTVHLKYNWKFPSWFFSSGRKKLIVNLCDAYTLEKYTVWHDMGKPLCKVTDNEGKVHYPNHSQRSHELFSFVYPDEKEIGELIKRDMDFHTKSAEQLIEEYSGKDKKLICTLLLTALAEIHSNARLFGGIESDSFKIKWKRLDKIGLKILEALIPSYETN